MDNTTAIPAAFADFDSSVFLAQAMAVADLLGSGDHEQYDRRTVNEASMLIFMLLDAVRELDEAARAKLRAAAKPLPEVEA